MSLLFNMLSSLVIAFLPRSKRLLISWLQSPCAVIWEPPKIVSVSIVSSPICYKVMGPDAMILVFWMVSFKPALSLSPFIYGRPIPVTAAFGLRNSYWPWWTYINEEEALNNQEDKMIYFAVMSQPFSGHPNDCPVGPHTAMATLARTAAQQHAPPSTNTVPLRAWAANRRDQYLAPDMGTWW